MEGTAGGDRKRRRAASPPSSDSGRGDESGRGTSSLLELPELALTHVASYLARPSRVMFAVAATAPPASWKARSAGQQRPPSAVNAILGEEPWRELDFEEVEESLASRLNDDDIRAVLACIDAGNFLKKLKLSGCVQFFGPGLEVLRGSSVLEHVDLCLVGQHEHPSLSPPPLINELAVIPVLFSVADKPNSSLRLIIFPDKWNQQEPPTVQNFIEYYCGMLESKNIRCSACNKLCRTIMSEPWVNQAELYGTQNYACHKCVKFYCDRPKCRLEYCNRCQKKYCSECSNASCTDCGECGGCITSSIERRCCDHEICESCHRTCQHCERRGCRVCLPPDRICSGGCGKIYCRDCEGRGLAGDEVVTCRCGKTYCSECRFLECSNDWCDSCKNMAKLYALQEEKLKLEGALEDLRGDYDELLGETEGLRRQNEELLKENGALRKENEELRKDFR